LTVPGRAQPYSLLINELVGISIALLVGGGDAMSEPGGAMENRDRDRVSKRETGTDPGERNRRTEGNRELDQNRETSASSGQKIGRSEELNDGGSMRDRNKENQNDRSSNVNKENEPSRKPESGGFGSATGRTGSMGNRGGGGSDVSIDELDRNRDSDSDRDRDSMDRNDRSEGRH
jgi:hypothetical protein